MTGSPRDAAGHMTAALESRVAAQLAADVPEPARLFARRLADDGAALAVLFYGSNLRTGALDGVLDYYVLADGEDSGIWPRVSYHEWAHDGQVLRAKVAGMSLATFRAAAAGQTLDTTIWARFCQPCALIWSRGGEASAAVTQAVSAAIVTASRLAAALGPARGTARDFWRALFRETYAAEFRVEKAGREESILAANRAHFEGLLPLALEAGGVAFAQDGEAIAPALDAGERRRILRWWRRRRRLGKTYNVVRLLRASATFEGAARYAAWKIERHTGIAVPLTPWRERHPLLAAPGVLLHVWRQKARRA